MALSMITDLIAAVTQADRQLDDQISKLKSLEGEINAVQQKVDVVLSGGSDRYGRNMLDQLEATKKQITETISNLQGARDRLSRVRMV